MKLAGDEPEVALYVSGTRFYGYFQRVDTGVQTAGSLGELGAAEVEKLYLLLGEHADKTLGLERDVGFKSRQTLDGRVETDLAG